MSTPTRGIDSRRGTKRTRTTAAAVGRAARQVRRAVVHHSNGAAAGARVRGTSARAAGARAPPAPQRARCRCALRLASLAQGCRHGGGLIATPPFASKILDARNGGVTFSPPPCLQRASASERRTCRRALVVSEVLQKGLRATKPSP